MAFYLFFLLPKGTTGLTMAFYLFYSVAQRYDWSYHGILSFLFCCPKVRLVLPWHFIFFFCCPKVRLVQGPRPAVVRPPCGVRDALRLWGADVPRGPLQRLVHGHRDRVQEHGGRLSVQHA